MPVTHVERVRELLADGAPHSHHEGYRLGVILHSRVSDLRRQGYRIRAWRDGDLYLYQMLSGPPSDQGLGAGEHGGPENTTAQTERDTSSPPRPGWSATGKRAAPRIANPAGQSRSVSAVALNERSGDLPGGRTGSIPVVTHRSLSATKVGGTRRSPDLATRMAARGCVGADPGQMAGALPQQLSMEEVVA